MPRGERGRHAVPGGRHRRLSAVAFASVLVTLCSAPPRRAPCITDEAAVAAHFRAGQEALKRGEFVRATEEFQKVLALDQNLLEAEVNLGLAYHSLGEYGSAVKQLTGALRERPDLPGPTIILGIDYLKLGAVEKAIPVLQRGLRLEPSNLEARRALATCYRLKEDFRLAANEYRELANLNPDKADAWFKLGHDCVDLSARLAYRGAQLYRDSAWGHRFLGDMLAQRDRWNDAAEEYLHSLASDPKQPGLHTSIGQAYLHAGKLEKAEAEFRLELQLDGRYEPAWLGLAEAQLAKGQASAALDAVGKVWEISPEYLALQRGFPTVTLPLDAARTLRADLQATPPGAGKDFLLAGLYAASGETAQADERWKAFQADFQVWQKAGDAVQDPCRADRYTGCAHWLQSRKPISAPELLLLGKTQFTLQRHNDAADTLARLLAIDKTNVETSYWLARSYQALGAECYDRLEESSPDSWRTHQLRAESYSAREAANDAIREYLIAIQLRPDEAELHEALGEVHLTKKSYDEAQAELEKSLHLEPSRARTLCLLGRLYMGKRETEKAVPYLAKALRYQPDMPEAYILLGTAYVRLGQYAEAIPELERAAPSDFYGDVHYQLSLAYRKLGKAELANEALARSEELRRTSAARHQAMVMGTAQLEREPD